MITRRRAVGILGILCVSVLTVPAADAVLDSSPPVLTLGAPAEAMAGVPAPRAAIEPVDTSRPYSADGYVEGPDARPVTDAVVDDGGQRTSTDGLGYWWLPEADEGPYVVAIPGGWTYRANVALPAGSVPGAVTLPYTAGVVSWQGGATEDTVVAYTAAPEPGLPGEYGASCVSFIDAATGASVAAAQAGEDADGFALWAASIPAEVDRVRVHVHDCGTGSLLTMSGLPTIRSSSHGATQPPTGAPTVWSNSSGPVFAFTAGDAGGSGVDGDSAAVFVDGSPVATGYRVIGSVRVYQAQARGLLPGEHVVDLSIADQAGNVGHFVFLLVVEDDPPIASSPMPSGTSQASPQIRLVVNDGGSRIDVTHSRFLISNGVVASALEPTYEPAAGEFVYQVPASGVSPHLGQAPLPPGGYTVTATVADLAGNDTEMIWGFGVGLTPL